MKKEELFELLGEIDDKFYEEAAENSEASFAPLEETAAVKLSPVKTPLWRIITPFAACVALAAAVGISAAFLNKNPVVPPDTSDSTLNSNSNSGSDIEFTNKIEITSGDVSECIQKLREKYPDLNAAEVAMDFNWQSRIMDINCDGSDEIVLLTDIINRPSNEEHLGAYVFTKTEDGVVESGYFKNEYLTSLDDLYLYDDGGQYWYYSFQYSNEQSPISANVLVTVYFDGVNYNPSYSLSYGKIVYEDSDREPVRFFRKWWNCWNPDDIYCEDNYYDISEEEFRELWSRYPYLPKYQKPELPGDSLVDVSEYPMLHTQTVPDVPGTDLMVHIKPGLQAQCLPKATLAVKQWGDYEIRLLGEEIRTDPEDDFDILHAYYVKIALCKDGKVLNYDTPHTPSVTMGQGGYRLYLDMVMSLSDFINLFELDDGLVVQFNYYNTDGLYARYFNESTFFGVYEKDGAMNITALMGETSAVGGGAINYSVELITNRLTSYKNTIYDIAKDIVYNFDFGAFSGNPFERVHYSARYALEYIEFKPGETEFLPKAILAQKQCGDYTIKLLAHNVRPSSSVPGAIDCVFPMVSVEKAGQETQFFDANIDVPLYANKLSEYIQPFETKDGIGFVLFTYLVPDDTFGSCLYYIIYNGYPILLDGNIKPKWYQDFTVDYENNSLSTPEFTITIDYFNWHYTVT